MDEELYGEYLTNPMMLAQIDQATAEYRNTTGHIANVMFMDGWEWHLCDNGHWHKVEPADG